MKSKSLLLALVCAILCAFNVVAAEGYAVYTPSNTTLTFYYGDKPNGAYSILNTEGNQPDWHISSIYSTVTKVVFDPSFAQARPQSTAYWFSDMANLTTITGLNYLKTDEVSLMLFMFHGCENLESLDLSNFNTSNVTSMSWMFSGCKKLANINLISFNTSNVARMEYMFDNCSSLTSLDLSSFNTSQVWNMSWMFVNCTNLQTVKVSNGWTTDEAVFYYSQMFVNCYSLVGGAGTTFDSNHISGDYAHIDGGPSNPGYFTAKQLASYDLWINCEQVTSNNCNNLNYIGGVSGNVKYNPANNTLTLENATLSHDGITNGCCIKSEIDGLTVNLIGTNSLSAQTGIRACAMDVYTTTISGTGTLSAQAKLAGIQTHSGKTITIDNVTDLSASSSKYGIFAASPDNTCILIKGSNTVVHANGSSGTIRNFNSFVLEDGLAITEPAGSYYNDGILYDADGNVASQVTIRKPSSGVFGDVTGDGMVDVDDVNAAINIILKVKTPDDYPGNANVTGEDVVDIEDINIIINIILQH